MEFDINIMNMSKDLIEDHVGDISDLPKELANTIVNIYYKHCYYRVYFDTNTDKIYVPDEVKETKDIIKGMELFVKNRLFISKSVEAMPDVIENIRQIEDEEDIYYKHTIELILDIYKYNIPNALNKSYIRRKIERIFCKVKEIPDLIDMMQKA